MRMKWNKELINHMKKHGFVRKEWNSSYPWVRLFLESVEDGIEEWVFYTEWPDGKKVQFFPSKEDRKAEDWVSIDILVHQLCIS